jgi:hypothetical protein
MVILQKSKVCFGEIIPVMLSVTGIIILLKKAKL